MLAHKEQPSDNKLIARLAHAVISFTGAKPPESQESIIQMDDVPESIKYLFILCLGILLILLAFAFNTPGEILAGSIVILTSPANLLTDYFQLANIGATLVNAGFMTLLGLFIVRMSKTSITGPVIAAICTVTGFSFFGKNLYNSMPIMLGVYCYSKAVRQPFGNFLSPCLFGTALSPLVSEFSFNIGLPLIPSLMLGIASGLAAGFVLPPLSAHFLRFHQGFSLYNTGFAAGIIGMVFMAVLRGFGVEINTVSILSKGHNLAFSVFLYGLSILLLLFGLKISRWKIAGFGRLLAKPGILPTDFITSAGTGFTLINMALLGFIATTYVLILGGELNGPVIGGIFTVVGFGAYGKHIRNVIPVLLGVFLVNLFNIHDAASSFALMAALFGTTLAPIAGRYGALAGVFAGILHMSLVTNIGFLHAGMNLYNNGFSGGFIAAVLCPLIDAIGHIKQLCKSGTKNGSRA